MRFHHLLAVSILTASSLAADDPAKITAEAVRENYRALFARVTDKPKSIGAEFAEGCVGFPEQEQMAKETGPHLENYVHYYLNGVAQSHRSARIGIAYPPGSVIVKEKRWGGYADREDIGRSRDLGRSRDFTRISAVAGMIKRGRRLQSEDRRLGVFLFQQRFAFKGWKSQCAWKGEGFEELCELPQQCGGHGLRALR